MQVWSQVWLSPLHLAVLRPKRDLGGSAIFPTKSPRNGCSGPLHKRSGGFDADWFSGVEGISANSIFPFRYDLGVRLAHYRLGDSRSSDRVHGRLSILPDLLGFLTRSVLRFPASRWRIALLQCQGRVERRQGCRMRGSDDLRFTVHSDTPGEYSPLDASDSCTDSVRRAQSLSGRLPG